MIRRRRVVSPFTCPGRAAAFEFRNSQQVLCGSSKEGDHLRLRLTNEAGLAHAADRLQPAENFLPSLSFALAAPVARYRSMLST